MAQFMSECRSTICRNISVVRGCLHFGSVGMLDLGKNVGKHVVINGFFNDMDIANQFADHFSSVFAHIGAENLVRDMLVNLNSVQSNTTWRYSDPLTDGLKLLTWMAKLVTG
jgi:hypothetical protein